MTKKQREEREAKFGLLLAIKYILLEVGPIFLEGYENDGDRFEFIFDGHRCRLKEILKAEFADGYLQLTVLAKGVELSDWEEVTMNFLASHFRYETLLRIAEEAFMCSNMCNLTEYGNDFDRWISDHLSNFFDSIG